MRGTQYIVFMVYYDSALQTALLAWLSRELTASMHGDRSFAVAGPSLWNDLPRSLREAESVDSFKRQLKTLLFERTYGQ